MLSLSAMPPNIPKAFELPTHENHSQPLLRYIKNYQKEKVLSLKKISFTTKEIDRFQQWYDDF